MSAVQGSTFILRELSAREVRAEELELSGGAGGCIHGSPAPSAGDAGLLRGVTEQTIA
jgi:hypothetical protein